MRCFVLSEELWSTWVIDVGVEREDLEHMSIIFVLSMKLWNTWKDKLEVLGIRPRAFHVDVEHKLWNIGSLAIVSLGVYYKYILALVLSKEL